MKRLRTVILTVIAAALVFGGVSSYAAKHSYKAGIINDYNYEGNDILTYAGDCIDTVFNEMEYTNVSYKEYTVSEGLNALTGGDVDFLAMVPFTEELTPYVDYSSAPVAEGFLSLFTSSDSEIYYEDFRSLNDTKIAMLHNSNYKNMLDAYAAKHGFTYSPVYYDSVEHMIEATSYGNIDAVLSPATTGTEGLRLVGKCGGFGYYFATRKGDADTLNTLNEAIARLNDDQPFHLAENYTKHFRIPYQNMVAMTYNDLEAIRSKDTLRVYVPDNYPMVFYDISESKYEGIYIDILEQIASNSGLKIEYVPDDLNELDVTIDSVLQGKADAILTVSGTMQEVIKATDPYTSLSYMPVGDIGTEADPENPLQVGIVKDDKWISEYITTKYPTWTITEYNSINSVLSAADHNKIDIALISTPDMQTKTSLIAHPGLEIKQFSVDIPVCLGISTITSPPGVVTMINNVIKNLYVPGEEFESKAYMLSHTYVPNVRDMLYANRLILIFLFVFIALIIAVLYWRSVHFRRLARLDPMTKIYNGGYFIQAANKILSKNPDKAYLMASIDAKNFKLVNDRFGTDIGDQTIIKMAKKITGLFANHALVARLQGDEFLAIMEDSPFKRDLLEKMSKEEIRIHNSSNYQVHTKIGVYPISKHHPTKPMSFFIDRANLAKEALPLANQNDLVYFTDEAEERLQLESEIEVDMVPALQRGEFIAYYQPKYDLATNKICGAEALVRWRHKDNGMISPGLFVPVFERNGFITEVDFCVYEQTLQMLKKRLAYHEPVATISMNVSRCHLSDPNFIPRLEELIEKYNIPKKYIEMEITESIFSEGDNSANELVYELKKRGFSVSMDDFGSGYSSLNLLRVMPIDTLKIDKVFIEDIDTSRRSLTIIEEILAMAKRINVRTICEGIETETQRDILRNAGCDMAQGYYYSKPLCERDFEKLLDTIK